MSCINNSGIGSSSLRYDGLGNIRQYSTTNSAKPHDLSYQYDNNFKLTGVTGTGATGYNFNHTSNGVADSYDARGNITHNGKRSFNYNLANQMTSSGNNSYLYDGQNRRVKTSKNNGAEVSYSLYSQKGRLLYRETPEGGVNYIFLGDKLIAKEGNIKEISEPMHYKPFGDSIEEAKDDVGYTGHKFDTDLGLSYMQQRYYDPLLGRFMSNDPVGYTAYNPVMSFNRYMYVNNNPYKYTDPDGKFLCGGVCVVGGAISLARVSIVAHRAYKTYRVGTVAAGTVTAVAGNSVLNESSENSSDESSSDKPGSRTEPKDLEEQLTLEEAQGGAGEEYKGKLGDPKYDNNTGTKIKITHNHQHGDGTSTEVHYDKDKKTGEGSGHKIKDDTNKKSRGNQ
ncbi:MAG: RHS repeat-associated protein [Phenylobacterium sp.]|jgi:RHS repeat-associated protein